MSSKTEKPTLQGQRIKTRKRDEKEKHDPNAFRDIIILGLNEIISPVTGTKDSQVEADLVIKEKQEVSLEDQVEQIDISVDDKEATEEKSDLNSESNGDNKILEESSELENKEFVIEPAHFESLSKFLDVSGSKLNYRRYGEVLLDILIAGGTLGNLIDFFFFLI